MNEGKTGIVSFCLVKRGTVRQPDRKRIDGERREETGGRIYREFKGALSEGTGQMKEGASLSWGVVLGEKKTTASLDY